MNTFKCRKIDLFCNSVKKWSKIFELQYFKS